MSLRAVDGYALLHCVAFLRELTCALGMVEMSLAQRLGTATMRLRARWERPTAFRPAAALQLWDAVRVTRGMERG